MEEELFLQGGDKVPEYISKIRTANGDMEIDYTALANKPVSDKTLSNEGNFADAKATGDAINKITPIIHACNASAYTLATVPGNAVVTRIEGKSQQDTFPSLTAPQAIKYVGQNGGVTVKCTSGSFSSQITCQIKLNAIGDIKDELCLLMPGESYLASSGENITVSKPTTVVHKRIGQITYSGAENETWSAGENNVYFIELSTAKRYFGVSKRNLISTSFRTTDNMPYNELADATCSLYNDPALNPTQNWLYVRCDAYPTLEEFKSYLTERPMTLLYPLATTYTEVVHFSSELYTPLGTCTVTTTDPLSPVIDIDAANNRTGAYILYTLTKGAD